MHQINNKPNHFPFKCKRAKERKKEKTKRKERNRDKNHRHYIEMKVLTQLYCHLIIANCVFTWKTKRGTGHQTQEDKKK